MTSSECKESGVGVRHRSDKGILQVLHYGSLEKVGHDTGTLSNRPQQHIWKPDLDLHSQQGAKFDSPLLPIDVDIYSSSTQSSEAKYHHTVRTR